LKKGNRSVIESGGDGIHLKNWLMLIKLVIKVDPIFNHHSGETDVLRKKRNPSVIGIFKM